MPRVELRATELPWMIMLFCIYNLFNNAVNTVHYNVAVGEDH
jgi:hypothetical protein